MSELATSGLRVQLLEVGNLPRGLAPWVLEHLPAPFSRGDIETFSIDLRRCRDPHRNQVDAGCVLEQLPGPRDGEIRMALLSVDLFFSVMTYVFGLTELGGRRGVLSCYRLVDELAGREAVLRQRMLVETIHELGHALGLVHCVVNECAMHRTLWPEGIDTKRASLCPSCLAALPPNGGEG